MTNPESPPTDLRWSQEARLRAIDEAAFWEGRVNRAGLVRRFGISVPQATNDLREYQARAPANLRYDTREKAYLAEPGFQPLFGAPEAEAGKQASEAHDAASAGSARRSPRSRSSTRRASSSSSKSASIPNHFEDQYRQIANRLTPEKAEVPEQ